MLSLTPHQVFHHRTLLSLTTALLLCTAAAAQELHLSPIPEVSPPAVQSAAVQSADSVPSSSSISSADTGFWFISTDKSPQSFRRNCPRFCPETSRYEQCAGYRGASFEEMRNSLEPGVPVCIVVHGSFVDRPSACYEATLLWKWVRSAAQGQRMQMIYMSWPSFRPFTPLIAIDTNVLGRRAARNGYYLAELVAQLPPECPVCLLGHSHGTRVISAGLHLLADGAIQGIQHPWARNGGRLIRTVFYASAMDHHWLRPGQRYDRALCSTQCLLNFRNHFDPALKIYTLRLPLIARRALGSTGLTAADRRQMGAFGNRVLDYDVSRVAGIVHEWPHYYSRPGLAMVMRNYVYFPDLVSNPVVNVSDVTTSEMPSVPQVH